MYVEKIIVTHGKQGASCCAQQNLCVTLQLTVVNSFGSWTISRYRQHTVVVRCRCALQIDWKLLQQGNWEGTPYKLFEGSFKYVCCSSLQLLVGAVIVAICGRWRILRVARHISTAVLCAMQMLTYQQQHQHN